ncbi:hypothetical protein CYY_000171 [Polysphondylium violaceum]|uniref:Transmembrane protein n=1 Tax=Polysphondylium violaceum TaxID=133409 RepID=A0A8J4Q4F1_9MYCE|nr:hypothetical protein CYY_000171 [Polysphondylium violaceum]
MNRFVFVILSSLLLFSYTSALTQEKADASFDGVVAGAVDNDSYFLRSYSFVNLGGSYASLGASLNGTLGGGAQADFIGFLFNAKTVNYLFTYSQAKLDINNLSGSASSYALNYRPTVIIEYKETNGEKGYQQGKDTILGWVRLDSLDYSLGKSDKTFKNSNGKEFRVTIVEAESKLFDMMFYISEAPVSVAGNDIGSSQSKIDVTIKNYYDPTQNKQSSGCTVASTTICASTGPSSDPDSRLALAAVFFNADASYGVDIDGKIEINSGKKEVFVGFSWVGHADTNTDSGKSASASVSTNSNSNVDGNLFVTSGGFANANARLLIHSFDAVRPTNVVWDPTIGASQGSFAIKISAPLVMMILLSLIVTLLM